MFAKLARLPVLHIPHTGTTEDALGNRVPTFGDPIEEMAYSIGPHTAEHGSSTSTETEVADVDMAMPKLAVKLKDRFSVDSETYEVVGVRDQTKGFHGWGPGIVIELKRWT